MSNYFVTNSNNTTTSLTTFFNTSAPQTGPTTNYQESNGTDIGNLFTLYMFGSRSLCRFLTGTQDIGFYYQRDGFTRASVLTVNRQGQTVNPPGVFNMSPWYVSSVQMQLATWIWNLSTAAQSAPINYYLWFYYTFFYSGTSNLTCTLWGVCDNIATFYLNQGTGISMNGGWPATGVNPNRGNITIVPGLNYIRVCAYNLDSGSPAGLLIAITLVDSTGSAIVTTNGDWAISNSNSYDTGALTYNATAT
jgi:hypothetical protein